MKTNKYNTPFTSLTIGLLLAAISTSAIEYTYTYRFTGTVEVTDPDIGFPSPESPSGGIEAQAGDLIQGSFTLDHDLWPRPVDTFLPSRNAILDGAVRHFELEINGQSIPFSNTSPGHVRILDEAHPEDGGWHNRPLTEKNKRGDAVTLSYMPEGDLWESGSAYAQIILNFTDRSGTLFDLNDWWLPEPVEMDHFDVSKGFIRGWKGGTGLIDRGIMFNIDSLEVGIELELHHHLEWPAVAGGFLVEESASEDAPWQTSSTSVLEVDGVQLLPIKDRGKLHRLRRPNYRFTGQLDATDRNLRFKSPVSPIADRDFRLEAPVTGFLLFETTNLPSEHELPVPMRSFHQAAHLVELSIDDWRVNPTGSLDSYLVDDVESRSGQWAMDPLNRGLADALTITTSPGKTLAGVLDAGLEFTLNLTDTRAIAVGDAGYPETIAMEDFDLTKGILRRPSAREGLLFQIETFEKMDRQEPLPVITTGMHLSWSQTNSGYRLEQSEHPEGPWHASNLRPTVQQRRNIVRLDMSKGLKFYRLSNR